MASRGAFTKVLIAAVLVGLAACVGYAVSYPERWNEDLTGMRRNDAWRLLGVPDVDYTEKGFDGWNRNAIFGAWVLIVRYGENERISGVERKFSWGLDYLSWDADYRKQWKRPESSGRDLTARWIATPSAPRSAHRMVRIIANVRRQREEAMGTRNKRAEDRLDAWYDGSAICIIAVASSGDPLDLGEHEVERFIEKLQACLKQVREEDHK